MITGRALLAGVLGWPVAHSRSPILHNYWLARHGIDGAYVPLPVRPEHFTQAIAGLRAANFRGANVTIPHKEAAYAICDTLDDAARFSGAVNTLSFTETTIHGSNTDGAGFLANLRAHAIDPAAGPALLLGAGGAARAIAGALLQAGVHVTITNRTADRARALARAIPELHVIDWEHRHAALADHAILVNTTAAGMPGQPPLHMDFGHTATTLAVADIVYVPLQTPLLRNASAHHLRTVNGLGMLVHQAIPSFSAWFGMTPAADDETLALLAANIPMSQ